MMQPFSFSLRRVMLQFLPIISDVLDRIIPDTNKRDEAKQQLAVLAASQDAKELEGRFGVLIAEAKSEHWIVASWRPITMLSFTGIVVNNYILAPYINLFFQIDVTLELPPDLWDLLKIGLGGYVVGRSCEKVAKQIKSK